MKITEKNILFPTIGNGDIYSCVTKDRLVKGLCTKDIKESSDIYYWTNVFPSSRHIRPWSIDHVLGRELYIENKIKHKVFSNDELLFMKEYIGYEGDITLDLLKTISQGYDICNFFVTSEIAKKLIASTQKFGAKYKHSSIIASPSYKEISGTKEFVYCVSIVDISLIFTNLYKKDFSGVGVAFEIFDVKSIIRNNSACAKAIYAIYTDNYEGIFYRDGKDNILHDGIDYLDMLSFQMAIEQYEGARKKYESLIAEANTFTSFSDLIGDRIKNSPTVNAAIGDILPEKTMSSTAKLKMQKLQKMAEAYGGSNKKSKRQPKPQPQVPPPISMEELLNEVSLEKASKYHPKDFSLNDEGIIYKEKALEYEEDPSYTKYVDDLLEPSNEVWKETVAIPIENLWPDINESFEYTDNNVQPIHTELYVDNSNFGEAAPAKMDAVKLKSVTHEEIIKIRASAKGGYSSDNSTKNYKLYNAGPYYGSSSINTGSSSTMSTTAMGASTTRLRVDVTGKTIKVNSDF